jgi:hypothetical protein
MNMGITSKRMSLLPFHYGHYAKLASTDPPAAFQVEAQKPDVGNLNVIM